ncbi:hypothetical protein [Polaribacter dokdonensis]|uniref:Uncharacterized protein n=1 Tax=Polaribacter dokdonensis DSW-5 TaxID=1300348 RepID=A0A0M9CHW7_9FLAO|nr:hypothetical protein [Polaribacter dokdonensis]KOY52786.1 hypothetical protein I602_2346 [Polaribacter dokdonensis DSW-5]SEE52323.1 hypothetical protein SAMN05444353_2121 [Polaribacter dokdonensis DSW-5]
MNIKKKPTTKFYLIGVLALIWNLMGVGAYLIQAFMTEEMIATLPEEQQAEFLVEHPAWYTALFAIAVFGGALACILLLARKKIAYYLFLVSGISAIAQQGYLLATVTLSSVVMPIMIIIFCIFLIWYSKRCITEGILN